MIYLTTSAKWYKVSFLLFFFFFHHSHLQGIRDREVSGGLVLNEVVQIQRIKLLTLKQMKEDFTDLISQATYYSLVGKPV